jgi:hypothetical protein
MTQLKGKLIQIKLVIFIQAIFITHQNEQFFSNSICTHFLLN